jgi:DNA-binding NarL/FixJ family response regulator
MPGVVIVTDVRFYREGLAELLARSAILRVCGTTADVDELLHLLGNGDADIVLLDVGLPDAIDCARRIASAAPAAKVVALALRETDHDVLAWAEAGLAGYVSRDRSVSELLTAIEGVARGELVCPPRIAAALLRRVGALALRADSGNRTPPVAALTLREREIVSLVSLGLTNKEIARRLGIQLATIKTHVHHILEKLGARRRLEIAAIARRM